MLILNNVQIWFTVFFCDAKNAFSVDSECLVGRPLVMRRSVRHAICASKENKHVYIKKKLYDDHTKLYKIMHICSYCIN